MLLPTESLGYVYTACYCEENVYKLCEQLVHQSAELYAVFVSNSHKQVSCRCIGAHTMRLRSELA